MYLTTKSFLKLFDKFHGSFLESYIILKKSREKQGQNPDNCFYAKSAEKRFYSEGEYDEFVNICREIIEEADTKDIKSYLAGLKGENKND